MLSMRLLQVGRKSLLPYLNFETEKNQFGARLMRYEFSATSTPINTLGTSVIALRGDCRAQALMQSLQADWLKAAPEPV